MPTAGLAREIGSEPAAAGRVTQLPPAVDGGASLPWESPPRGDGPLRVLYAGTVGLAHGISTLLEAARLAGPETVQVTVAGGGAEAELLAATAPGNVRVLGIVPSGAVPELYAQADAGVILLRDRPIFAGALPTKLLECLASGRPAIVSARGEAAELVAEAGAGVSAAPEDPRALADAFRALRADPALRARMGAAGRAAVLERHDRAVSVAAWDALLERVAQRARR